MKVWEKSVRWHVSRLPGPLVDRLSSSRPILRFKLLRFYYTTFLPQIETNRWLSFLDTLHKKSTKNLSLSKMADPRGRKRKKEKRDEFLHIQAKGQYLKIPKGQEWDEKDPSTVGGKLNMVAVSIFKMIITCWDTTC